MPQTSLLRIMSRGSHKYQRMIYPRSLKPNPHPSRRLTMLLHLWALLCVTFSIVAASPRSRRATYNNRKSLYSSSSRSLVLIRAFSQPSNPAVAQIPGSSCTGIATIFYTQQETTSKSLARRISRSGPRRALSSTPLRRPLRTCGRRNCISSMGCFTYTSLWLKTATIRSIECMY